MNLARFPRRRLAQIPTPLSYLPRFSSVLAGPEIWVKRDDQTGLATGGNKARKLEFILGDALKRGADVVLTAGGPQSNHARMTAAACAAVGMESILFLTGEDPGYRQGNLFLDELMGAQLRFVGDDEPEEAMDDCAEALRREGQSPYIVPLGGSVPLGSIGYVLAAFEMWEQFVDEGADIEHVVMASGSGGTAAGLLAAISRLCPHVALHAVSVSRGAESMRERICRLTDDTLKLLGWPSESYEKCLQVHDEFIGEGYAVPTAEGIRAGQTLAQTEGIVVDTTYAGKALAGLVGLVDRGVIPDDEAAVFLHTGGVAALFEEAHRGTFASFCEDQMRQ